MKHWNLHTAIGAFSVVVAASFAPAVAANAQSSDDVGAHCAVQGQPIGSSKTSADPVCFDTDDEVVAYLSSIGVTRRGHRHSVGWMRE